MKEIDLKKSVYELTEAYPELIEFLKELGFVGVVRPVGLPSAGSLPSLRAVKGRGRT